MLLYQAILELGYSDNKWFNSPATKPQVTYGLSINQEVFNSLSTAGAKDHIPSNLLPHICGKVSGKILRKFPNISYNAMFTNQTFSYTCYC